MAFVKFVTYYVKTRAVSNPPSNSDLPNRQFSAASVGEPRASTSASTALTNAAEARNGRTLALGFGTAVAMWALGYLAMMAPGLIIGELLFALILGCLLAGGHLAGHSSATPGMRRKDSVRAGLGAGIKVGLTAATLNLLLIGSLAGGDTPRDKFRALAVWMIGTIIVSALLAGMGGAIGGAIRARSLRAGCATVGGLHAAPINWFNRFTIVAAVTVFLLLITGGLVTGLRAGLAVDDWPTTFGHNMLLYPLSQMIG